MNGYRWQSTERNDRDSCYGSEVIVVLPLLHYCIKVPAAQAARFEACLDALSRRVADRLSGGLLEVLADMDNARESAPELSRSR